MTILATNMNTYVFFLCAYGKSEIGDIASCFLSYFLPWNSRRGAFNMGMSWLDLALLFCLWKVATAVDGGWSEWSNWSACSVSCGQGLSRRYRACDNPAPSLGSKWCVGKIVETEECEGRRACPVDGGWTEWTAFSECSTTCGQGARRRTRSCTDPFPIFGGKNCVGEDVESEPCINLKDCPRDGGWSSWGSWTPCSMTCGFGVKQKFRTCDNPLPAADGKPCFGQSSKSRACNSSQICPVNGQWSDWSGWSPCSVTCGSGQRQRKRSCDDPPAQFGGKHCNDSVAGHIEIGSCQADVEHCAVNGAWSEWSDYGPCETLNCIVGNSKAFAFRHRSCNNPLPAHGGSMCQGRFLDAGICTEPVNCRRNGGWSMWSEWQCDGLVAQRTRFCDNPSPSNGGRDCPPEEDSETHSREDDELQYNAACEIDTEESESEALYDETGVEDPITEENNVIDEYDY